MSNPYIGEIRAFGFHFAPIDWAFCNGQIVSIAQNTTLYSILGTTFGGDGQSTFGLPNMQDNAPMHWGNGAGLTPRVLGEQDGSASVTITTSTMPSHNHMVTAGNGTGTQVASAPGNTVFPGQANPGAPYLNTSTTVNTALSPKAVGVNGGSQPHSNQQPLLALNFCIALYGIFPTRN